MSTAARPLSWRWLFVVPLVLPLAALVIVRTRVPEPRTIPIVVLMLRPPVRSQRQPALRAATHLHLRPEVTPWPPT